MKRVICILLMQLALLAAFATGAQDDAAKAPVKDTASTLAEKLVVDPNVRQTITVMSWNHTALRRELMQKTIDLFNAKYPNITIDHSPVEDYMQAYKLAFDSGDAPDIVYVDDTNQDMLVKFNYLNSSSTLCFFKCLHYNDLKS